MKNIVKILTIFIIFVTAFIVFVTFSKDDVKQNVSYAASSHTSDVQLMARAINGEARGEPYNGMVAVAATVLNRVADSRFPKSISGVVYEPGAYTCVADGQINLEPNEQAKKAAQDAINGWDPTSGCIYYFNPNTATSSWIWSRPQVITIGKHIFCK